MKKFLLLVFLLLLSTVIWSVGSADSEEIDIATVSEGKYLPYNLEDWEKYSDKNRVLFFHASWCITCRSAERDILKNFSKLGPDTYIFKIDYDTSTELKAKYGVVRQHTFIIFDQNNNVLKQWNGGKTSKIIREIGEI